MAYKQKIPQAWKNIHPNVAKLPFIYNLDDAVGIGCPNKRLDVMMVQVFLQRWDTLFFLDCFQGRRDPNAPPHARGSAAAQWGLR